MRWKIILFLVINLAVVSFLIHSVWTLLSLLYVDGSDDAILDIDLGSTGSTTVSGPLLIPKIIHQTYKNDTIPEVWREAQQSCIDMHPDYIYMLWTDESAREFIERDYSWFLETWDGYPYSIMRADAIRYFVLNHFGGVYIDLDDGCQRRLDPLLAYPAWLRLAVPTGISNDIMGAIPGHPFFERVIHALPKYNRNWVAPYVTVMSSTGPLFLSLMWRHFSEDGPHPTIEALRILSQDIYMGHDWSFFTRHAGSSWHNWDSDLIFWAHVHWIQLTICGFLVAGVFFTVFWLGYRRAFLGSKGPPNRPVTGRRWLSPWHWRRSSKPGGYIELDNRLHDV